MASGKGRGVIAVTGASGHLGQWVVARLLETGNEVLCISRSPRSHPAISGLSWGGPVRTLRWDIREPATAEAMKTLRPAKGLIHLAAHVPEDTARNSWEDSLGTLQTNVQGTINVLNALEGAEIASLVYASSFEVYGVPRSIPIGETHPTLPVSAYGASKLAGEKYLRLFAEQHGLASWILRMPAVYGPGDTLKRAIGNFIRSAVRGDDLVVHGTGEDRRDLLYVGDAVDAMERCLSRSAGCVLNLGTGAGYSVLEMAEAVREVAGGRVAIEKRERVKQRVDFSLSADRALAVIGWTARTPLRTGIKAQLDWARSGH